MLVNCPSCSARVDAEEIANVDEFEQHEDGPVPGSETRISLLRCPACRGALVSKQIVDVCEYKNFGESDLVWARARRVWPEPEGELSTSIPPSVSVSLGEARGCLTSGFYTASVVLSGRALEGIARYFQVIEQGDERIMLGQGLQQLYETGKIDKRLLEWGEELREHRNLAAHATDHVFEQADAQDLFEFVTAICEYLFVLQDRYDRFVNRKEQRNAQVKA